MELCIPQKILRELRDYLLANKQIETHCFLFGGMDNQRLLVRSFKKTPPEAYEKRSSVLVELKKDYVVQMLEYARQNGFFIIDAHSHPWACSAIFSRTDDQWGLENAKWLKEKIQEGVFPPILWGMLLATQKEMVARIYDYKKEAFVPLPIITPLEFRRNSPFKANPEIFSRQILLWGEEAQRRLAGLRVAVVGLGGLGALIVEKLVRMGVRHFTLIDGDQVEISNLNRLTGFYRQDLGLPKVTVAAQNIYYVAGERVYVREIREFISEANLEYLKPHDLIIGAVDREGARLLLNEFSVRYLIPYIDVGTGIKVEGDKVINMGGQIRFVNPGTTPCLQCYAQGIDPFEAALDLMSEEDRQVRRALGYIEGTNLSPEPSVIPLNGILAALCAQEISKMVTGFHEFYTYVYYDALEMKIRILDRERPFEPQSSCPVCGAGGVLGLGENSYQTYFTEDEMDLALKIWSTKEL